MNKEQYKEFLKKATMHGSKTFDEAVATFFKPIAQRLGLPLVKIQDGVYEMPSPYFILRLELHSGHSGRNFSATLRQVSLCEFVDRIPGIQYGVGSLLPFNGEDVKPIHFDMNSYEDFLKKVQWYADATQQFGVPYLLGLKDDFEAFREFMRKRSEPEVERMRQMQQNIEHNMKNVRQEWPVVIPREEGEEWDTVKELKVANIQFLGDLDGEKVRVFKEKFIEFFKSDRSVEKAYLARIIGQGLPANGALCLRTQFDFDKAMRKKIGKIFIDAFNLQESFSVIFLTDEQESSLAKVCRPFFERA